ncbi:LRP5_6 [Mytilus coruscus]|uniref:LRP5_6 n=1 Tax=Mytilus coruscus TaxID=42192 RepID=A0A6J8D5Y5_MYTCO|nr:LRP5_6 [Mytilus coruscus]
MKNTRSKVFHLLIHFFFVFNYYELSLAETIEGTDSNLQLIFTDSKNIIILDTETGNKTVVAEGYNYALFVDYHQSRNLIFWSDMRGGTISRINYPSSGKTSAEVIIRGSSPLGIAVDQIHDHLYWADTGLKSIFRSNINGSNTITILDNMNHPVDIELDMMNGWLYFNDNDIEKCRIDGTDRQTVIGDIGTSENILLDFDEGRLYWTDNGRFKIRSALLNGSDITTVYDVSPWNYYLMGFDISDNNIYFSDWNRGKLYSIPRDDENAVGEVIYSSNVYMMDVKIYKLSENECVNYKVIRHEEKRSAGYKTDLSLDIPVTDDALEHGWYRIESVNGDDIPTYAPGVFHCGTYNPIWLNGSFPGYGDKNVTVEACIQTADHICDKSIYITITNCGTFYVYYLQNTTKNSAYCFGSGLVLCPQGLSSNNGYYPGCTSLFPNETVLPMIEPILIEGETFDFIPFNPKTPSLLPVFRCTFDEVPEESYVYDIYWHINGEFVKNITNISYSQVNTTDLKDSDWRNTHHLNMKVMYFVSFICTDFLFEFT